MPLENIAWLPSPNFDEREADTPIDMLVLHYTGMQTAEEALSRLTDEKTKVSAHYFAEEDGKITALVREEQRAWHAERAISMLAPLGLKSSIPAMNSGTGLFRKCRWRRSRPYPLILLRVMKSRREMLSDIRTLPRTGKRIRESFLTGAPFLMWVWGFGLRRVPPFRLVTR